MKYILYFTLWAAPGAFKFAPGKFSRTPDILHPKQTRYLTALYPEIICFFAVAKECGYYADQDPKSTIST